MLLRLQTCAPDSGQCMDVAAVKIPSSLNSYNNPPVRPSSICWAGLSAHNAIVAPFKGVIAVCSVLGIFKNINAARTYMPPYDLQHAGNRFLHRRTGARECEYILRQRAAHHAVPSSESIVCPTVLCVGAPALPTATGYKTHRYFSLHFGSVQRRVCLLIKREIIGTILRRLSDANTAGKRLARRLCPGRTPQKRPTPPAPCGPLWYSRPGTTRRCMVNRPPMRPGISLAREHILRHTCGLRHHVTAQMPVKDRLPGLELSGLSIIRRQWRFPWHQCT